jgi:hypothetical protein
MRRDTMSDEAQEDLRATSESISADAERLKSIEDEKVRLEPGDPRLEQLAAEAERLAAGLAVKTNAQSDIVEELASDAADG